jgi:hypothetical protein
MFNTQLTSDVEALNLRVKSLERKIANMNSDNYLRSRNYFDISCRVDVIPFLKNQLSLLIDYLGVEYVPESKKKEHFRKLKK